MNKVKRYTTLTKPSPAKETKPTQWGRLSSLTNPDLKLIIFGGKGGSGKTTSAAATALYLNKIHPHRKILAMSVDPAHSLADSFNIVVQGNKITLVVKNVWCLETDAEKLLTDYKNLYGEIIKKIAGRATYFDEQDIESFLELSLPGLDEVMAIIAISNLLKSDEFDLIVLDTAPTGHTKVLLSLPATMEQWIDLVDKLLEKHRFMVKTMIGRYRENDADAYIEDQREDIRNVKELLADSTTTEFIPVTIPQPMSIFEVEKLVQELIKGKIPVKNVIVNRVMEESKCPLCSSMVAQQQSWVHELEKRFAGFNLVKAPQLPHEVRGQQSLMEYARIIFEGERYLAPASVKPSSPSIIAEKKKAPKLQLQERSFIIFGGKGGVGKSVIAAASAVHLARTNPAKKVLIFSTDPAHSLSDAFNTAIGNKVTRVGQLDNLFAMEIEGKQLLEDFKQELKDDIEEAFEKFLGGNLDMRFDREILQELFSVTPPGLDELMALRKISDLLKDGNYDTFILDSAASGHMLRFLELPHLVIDWLNTIYKLLLKYKESGLVRFYGVTEHLLELSKGTREIMGILSDPKSTEFVMITIPEAMAVAEAEDLAGSLNRIKTPSSNLIVNMVVPPTRCAFCAIKREEQLSYLKEIEAKFANHVVVQLPLFAQSIRGVDGLNKLAQALFEA